MSYTEEYLKLREERLKREKKRKEEEKKTSNAFTKEYLAYRDKRIEEESLKKAKSGDIAPVKETEETGLFKSGLFEDGYQFGDVTGSILGTVADTATGIVQGAGGLVEGITDLALYGVSGVSDLVGADSFADDVKRIAQKDSVNDVFSKFRENTGLDDMSLLGDMGYGVAQGLGQIGAIILTGGAAGAAGLSGGAVSALTTGVMGLSSMGSGMSEAYQGGATDEEALAYGTMKGTIDAGTELIFGGLGKTVKALGISKGLSSLDDVFAKKLSAKISEKIANEGIKQFTKNSVEFGVKASAEGLEEFIAGGLTAGAKKLSYMSEEDIWKLIEDENLLEQFAIGTITSAIAQGGDFGKSVKTGRDFVSGLTTTEESVVEKEVEKRIAEEEKDGKTLANKEKNKIYDEVLKDLDKGYISIDTIEETLGGDTYKAYKDRTDTDSKRESELVEKIESLENLPKEQITVKQSEDLTKARQQLEELRGDNTAKQYRTQLDDEMLGVVKGSKLAESYNERARRGQKFEADLTKYDDKQKAVIQKAVDSGILNNTNRTHEFVDMVAKISADKGVLFDFTNNTKLKDSGFALNGKTVNGFVTKDGVTVNIDSHKSLNNVVGHEITHVLEGTELYTELQNALFEYAKAKGDFDSRHKTITELYKGVKGADVNGEIAADLVGDYLFSDADFINNLSTKNRNVFQKIYDEIKYLCKIATAGSKEARQLEKVKRAFEKAYKEGGKAKGETKYSVSDKNIKDYSTGYGYGETYFTMSYEQDGEVVGTLEYGVYEGEPNIKMIEVSQKHRRKGIGTKLLQELQKKYPNVEINFGMSTPDGTKLIENSTYTVENKEVSQKLARIEELRKKLEEYDKGYEHYFDNDLEIPENYAEDYNELYDEMRDLQKAVNGKKATKTFVKTDTDTKYSLTPEQQEYFKDSKVRDEDGNLKVMYHGTSKGGHTVFDTYGSNYGLFGQGSYFTDNKSVAESYTSKGKGNNPQVYETYLNITNPIDMDAEANPDAWKKAFPDADFPESGTNERFYRAMEEYFRDEEYSKWEAAEGAMEALEGMGYDGVTHIGGGRFNKADDTRHRVYIAFHPEQIKNIDNGKPTDSADIRFSLSDNEGTKLTKEQGEYFKDSKMRDDNGNLMVMYHGSQDAGFHEFETMFSDDGTSFFFTDSNKVAKSYSGTEETYTAKTFRTAEDFNRFFAEIGADEYEVKYENGWFDLYEDGVSVAQAETAKMLYDEFCDWTGLGKGSANYKVYLNLKNPLIVDAKGRSWDSISREFSQEVADRYNSLTAEEKEALSQLAAWEDVGIFKGEINEAIKKINDEWLNETTKPAIDENTRLLVSAHKKLGDREFNAYDAFTIASDNFSEESIKQFAVKEFNTRDYAQRAKAQGYDGVIFKNIEDNGAYASGLDRYNKSTVAIAFEANQIKSVANENPTERADIRYSLSADSEGRELSAAQKSYFKGSKVVDDNGNLKVMYHGTPNGDFSVFKDGTYFTENKWYADLYQNPGASSISTGKVAKNPKTFEVYLDIKKPFDIADKEARDIYINDYIKGGNAVGINPYLSDAEYSKITSVDWTEGEDLREFLIDNGYDYDGLVLDEGATGGYGDDVKYRGKSYVVFSPEQVKNADNLNPTDNPDISKSLSAEGEIPKRKSRNGVYGEDIRLEAPTEQIAPVRKDIAKNATTTPGTVTEAKKAIAPVAENLQSEPTLLDLKRQEKALEAKLLNAVKTTDRKDPSLVAMAQEHKALKDRIKQMEAEESAIQSERLSTLGDEDAPPEMEAPFYGENESVTPDNPFDAKDIKDVGNPKQKAYMYENPEVKPFFQSEAQNMLWDLENSQKGERFPILDEQGYITEWTGVKRHTTDDIAYLRDNFKYTYEQIKKGLNAIIEDNGAENNAVSKRIEFLLNDRLMKGYSSVDGMEIPANQEYINLLNEKQIIEYNEEARKQFFEYADDYAPPVVDNTPPNTPPTDDIAPSKAYEAIKPRDSDLTDEEAQWAKNKMARADKAEPKEHHTAEILDAEVETTTKKQRGWSQFVSNFIDKLNVFETLSLKTHNRELMGKANQMLSAESSAQWLIGNGTKGVKSLNAIREEVEKTGLTKQFYEYLYHKHNVDRMTLSQRYQNTKDKPVYGYDVTAAKSQEIVNQYEFAKPAFKAYAKDVYDYMNYLRKMLVDGGVITQETADLWSEMYPNYVPIRRLGDSGLNINVPLDTGRTGVNAPIKGATGGSRDILPLFDTMAMRTEQTFKAVAKNRFGVELKNTLKSEIKKEAEAIMKEIAVDGVLPEGTKVRAHDRENVGEIKSYNKATNKYTVYFENKQGQTATVQLDADIITPLQAPKRATANGIDEAIDNVEKHEELLKKGENGRKPTFTVFENGERVEFEITEDMYDALKPKSEGLAYVNPVANAISKVHRGILTEFNPAFMLTNPIKDAQDVLINSQHPAQTYKNFPKAISELWGKSGKWYTEYMENGGEQNTYFDDKTNSFKKDDRGIKKLIGMPLNAISNANNFIERIPRLAEYIASREAGASVDVAMLDAARVTTNFAAGGDVTKFLNRNGATFLNASVQGFNQQVRNVREAKANGLKGWVQLATKVALAGLPATILNRLLWEDDEEYEELSDYVKQNYYVVAKFDDGKFVRIPKGRTMAVIQNAFEQTINAATGNDETDLASFLDLAVSNLAPNNPIDNNIIAPVMQVANNKTWYGEDLVPSRLKDLPKAEQYDESTDAISKWLGEKQDLLSPYQINYLLNQYSGGIGDMVLPMLTPEAESGDNSILGNMLAPLKDKFTTDSVMNNQNVSDFYSTVDELTKNAKSSKATDEDVLKYKYMNSVNAELSELYAQKREIQNSSLSDKAKYSAVRDIQKQIDELTKESLNTYNSVTVDGGYAKVGDRHYRTNKEGEWEKITDKQLEKQNEVTNGLGISASEYWSDKAEYDYAYESPEKYAVSKAVGGYESYKKYSSELYDIKADKDSSGKTISGSRKEKVIEYINNLDADYGEKIILFKSEYNADDTYNQDIVDYLNSRDDISYEDMAAILKELGFTVYDSGVIEW